MKRNLLLIIILFVTCGNVTYGQLAKTLPGAFGLTFGSSKTTAKEVMRKQNAKLSKETDSDITYEQVQLGSQKSDMLICKFVNNKLYEIVALFLPEEDAFAQRIFNDLKEIVENKYGKGKYFRNFKGIYEDGDGYEMQAVWTGNATISAFWVDFQFDNSIILEIKPNKSSVFVRLAYQDGKLIEEAIKKQESLDADIF